MFNKKKYFKKYYQENKKELRKYQKEWYQKNKEKRKEYIKNNKEKIIEVIKKWKEKNKDYTNNYYQKNREKRKECQKRYRGRNKEKIKEHNKEYNQRLEVKERKRKYEKKIRIKKQRKEYKQRPEIRIIIRLRGLFYIALKNYTKTGKIKSADEYGINYKEIIKHLKPLPNNLNDFDIHHIKPLVTFEFINKDGSINLEEIKKAFVPENHKLILREEHNKINHWDL